MRWKKKFFSLSGHAPDYTFVWTAVALVVAGFVFLSSASSDLGKIQYNDTYYFLKMQFFRGLLPGLLGLGVAYLLYYRFWKKIIPYLFFVNIILLVLVFTPFGHAANGATRWLNIGGFLFQPSELLKVTFILYIASLLSSSGMRSRTSEWRGYLIFILVSGIVAGLIFFQPATTMAVIVIGSGVIMYLLSGASFKQILLSGVLFVVIVVGLIVATPYRHARVLPFWNNTVGILVPSLTLPSNSSTVDTFHRDQSLRAIEAGGIWGVGFGKSSNKFSVLPEPMGDSIFAVIAEEEGFVGATLVILAFIILLWRGISLAFKTHDDFAKLALIGLTSSFGIQAFIHIASNCGLMPFTGVPLPFISYGGTSMAISLTVVGLIANISRYT